LVVQQTLLHSLTEWLTKMTRLASDDRFVSFLKRRLIYFKVIVLMFVVWTDCVCVKLSFLSIAVDAAVCAAKSIAMTVSTTI